MDTKQKAMLSQLYVAWTEFRNAMFWLRWVAIVLFVLPSVTFCFGLAVYSDWSFASIPREILQFAAETAKHPAAADGYVWIDQCVDQPDVPHGPMPQVSPRAVCNMFAVQQRSIDAVARDDGRLLSGMYALCVFTWTCVLAVFGVFASSRRTFLASIQTQPARNE
ncbi:hypothetical protein G3O06_23635 [Burkholderia sp. Ac-20345]|uniref:hypothetical protein n=1 Tax=Burkholderia sp. Ac-20345 TaxID=2703891 RepID=UPI00197C1231|nr:hypothetical protein [Burkholderia sp. Ac-20345]MBN3780510.1 hypothetical protein [Burkholderia sp. Ac-20345]